MMKSFYNIDEVLNYRRHCPQKNCGHGIFGDVMTLTYEERGRTAGFTIGDSTLIVDCASNKIVSYSETQKLSAVYGIGSGSVHGLGPNRHLWTLSNNGTDMFALHMSCNKCSLYGFTVQVAVSLKQGTLLGLHLNSEFTSVKQGAKVHKINNVYAVDPGITEMTIYHEHLSSQHPPLDKVQLPLIPLDVDNPEKALERIKKLLVFL
jgi:hypothetical protein